MGLPPPAPWVSGGVFRTPNTLVSYAQEKLWGHSSSLIFLEVPLLLLYWSCGPLPSILPASQQICLGQKRGPGQSLLND